MKRVLIISYYWPPTGGSGVQRWVKFAKYLPSEGWQPVIYTPENPEQLAVDASLEAEVPAEAEVIRRRILEPYGIYKKLLRRSGHSKEAVEVNPVNAQNKSFVQKVAMWVRGNFFRPDPRCLWITPSVKFLKKYLEEHPVDLIVSTGPPQSMHLIGRRLSLETGVPWIADFRDPWTDIFYYKHLGLSKSADRKHHALEQSVLDEADAVIAVTPLVQADFQAKTQTPVHLITNGFDPDDFPKNTEARNDGKFRIVHTGLFAADSKTAGKIKEAGGVKNVDLSTIPKHRSHCGRNGVTSLNLFGIIVTNGISVCIFADAVNSTGHIKQALSQGGLTAAAVAQKADITDRINSIHGRFLLLSGRTVLPLGFCDTRMLPLYMKYL